MAKKKIQDVTTVAPRLLTIQAAAIYLSCKVWFLRTLVWEKKIAHVRAGHTLLFDRQDLDKFVERQKIQARA